MNSPYHAYSDTVSQAEPEARALFIRKTYSHLAAALLVFAGLTGLMLETGIGLSLTRVLAGSRYSWLIVMGAFMGVSWIANKWAMSDASVGKQYMGLGLYTVA